MRTAARRGRSVKNVYEDILINTAYNKLSYKTYLRLNYLLRSKYRNTLNTSDGEIKIVGIFDSVNIGESLEVEGEFTYA